jgi:hypothetical protein
VSRARRRQACAGLEVVLALAISTMLRPVLGADLSNGSVPHAIVVGTNQGTPSELPKEANSWQDGVVTSSDAIASRAETSGTVELAQEGSIDMPSEGDIHGRARPVRRPPGQPPSIPEDRWAPPEVATYCVTDLFSCPMGTQIPVGSQCYCSSSVGPVWGRGQ